jgi:hypothetical protein
MRPSQGAWGATAFCSSRFSSRVERIRRLAGGAADHQRRDLLAQARQQIIHVDAAQRIGRTGRHGFATAAARRTA